MTTAPLHRLYRIAQRASVHLTLAVLLIAALAWAQAASAQGDTHLVVGYYDNPPLSFRDQSDAAAGVMPDVMREIADERGWTVEFRFYHFAEGLEALQAGELDAYGPLAYSPEREEYIDYANTTLYTNWGQVVTRPENREDYDSVVSLDRTRLAVLREDTHYTGSSGIAELADRFAVEIEFAEYSSYTDIIEAVAAGEVEAGVLNRLVASTQADEAGLVPTPIIFNPVEIRIGFTEARDMAPVIAALDDTLDEWISDPGSPYNLILDRHFPAAQRSDIPVQYVRGAILVVAIALVLAALALYLRHQVVRRTRDLERAKGRLEAVLRGIPEAVFVLDRDDRVTDFKPSASFAPLVSPDAFLGRSLHDIPLPAQMRDSLVRGMREARESRSLVSVDYEIRAPGEPARYYAASMQVTSEDDVVSTVRDVTAGRVAQLTTQERAEELERLVSERAEELVEANLELERASRAKTVFLARVSHELRTPLNSVIGFSKVLLQGMAGELNDEQRRQISMIERAGVNLLTLVNELLDLSRIEGGGLVPEPSGFSLPGLVREVLGEFKMHADERRIALVADIGEGPEVLFTDRRLLQQVLRNLVDNAIKFTEEGAVTIRTFPGPNSTAVIEVIDTGMGMSPNETQRMFELFYRDPSHEDSQIAGYGVGLAICDRIMHMLGGRVHVASDLGHGATFQLTVPPLFETSSAADNSSRHSADGSAADASESAENAP